MRHQVIIYVPYLSYLFLYNVFDALPDLHGTSFVSKIRMNVENFQNYVRYVLCRKSDIMNNESIAWSEEEIAAWLHTKII